MSEKKTFKKKELNKDDYKKDEKIIGGVKKGLGLLAFAATIGIGILTKGKFDISKKK